METGFSLLKSAVNDLSNSSFSAFRAKQKSEILFWAVIKIYKIINNNKYIFKIKMLSANFKYNNTKLIFYSKLLNYKTFF